MAQDIDVNKTFFTAGLIPPITSGVGYQLSAEWGSRVAICSVRARGLFGMGTVNPSGTTIEFPSNYFNDIPIINIMEHADISQDKIPYVENFSSYPVTNTPSCNLSNITKDGFTIYTLFGRTLSWTAKGS